MQCKRICYTVILYTEMSRKGKRKVQGVPQSQTAALPRPQEEEETDLLLQAFFLHRNELYGRRCQIRPGRKFMDVNIPRVRVQVATFHKTFLCHFFFQ